MKWNCGLHQWSRRWTLARADFILKQTTGENENTTLLRCFPTAK